MRRCDGATAAALSPRSLRHPPVRYARQVLLSTGHKTGWGPQLTSRFGDNRPVKLRPMSQTAPQGVPKGGAPESIRPLVAGHPSPPATEMGALPRPISKPEVQPGWVSPFGPQTASLMGADLALAEASASEPPAGKSESKSSSSESKRKPPSTFWARAARIGAAICIGLTLPVAALFSKPPLEAVPESDFCAVAAVAENGVSPCTTGNQITSFEDGADFSAALVREIDGAQQTLWLNFFHIGHDASVQPITDAIARARARGVDVKLVVDNRQASGDFKLNQDERLRDSTVSAWRQLGVDVRMPRYGQAAVNHRKLVVVDGRRAMVLGHNLGGNYLLPRSEGWTYHDLGHIMTGPVVHDVASVFNDSWVRAGGPALSIPQRMSPFTTGQGVDAQVQVLRHNALSDRNIEREIVQRIDAATESVSTMNGFGVTDEVVDALIRAHERGVRVNYVWGQASKDSALMAGVGIERLIAAGVPVYAVSYPLHMKLWIADDVVLNGSANNDGFSMSRNDELMVQMRSPSMAAYYQQNIIARAIAGGRRLQQAPVAPSGTREQLIARVVTPLINKR